MNDVVIIVIFFYYVYNLYEFELLDSLLYGSVRCLVENFYYVFGGWLIWYCLELVWDIKSVYYLVFCLNSNYSCKDLVYCIIYLVMELLS